MGRLNYDGAVSVDVEDRALAHLQIVIANKLRRGEPFHFTWALDASTGGGRTSVWMNPQTSLTFRFAGSRACAINRRWLDALMSTANSASGLHLVPEPADSGSDWEEY